LTEGVTQTKKILLKMMKLTSVFCIPIFLFLIFAGKWVLSLFGTNYIDAYPALVILSIGLSINTILGSHMTYLQFSGKQLYALLIQIIAVIIGCLLNFILIPLFVITGAAISHAASLILMTLWISIASWYQLLSTTKKNKYRNYVNIF
ncbi:MAG: polysaccharide biosynthesis C-terminal domain-containing protein, partial [Spirochaetales bacterium]|nr:polysaccharide biosynthesis C-terminal domain-containing protein [Spirochaetales bacterium]